MGDQPVPHISFGPPPLPDAPLCGSTPLRPPLFSRAPSLSSPLSSAIHVPLHFNACTASMVRCRRMLQLRTPFSSGNDAPPPRALMRSHQASLHSQFWWVDHPENAPKPFGWRWPAAEQEVAKLLEEGRRASAEHRERASSVTRLRHNYTIAIGRVVAPRGAYVEMCQRCYHDGTIYVPPSGGKAGASIMVDWKAHIIADPRAVRRASASYYKRALQLHPIASYARLLTLLQHFSSDYGHFLTELLPRAVAALPELQRDPHLLLLVDCSARFVLPWLQLLLGVDASRVVCVSGKRIIHADCLAFSRFAGPFTSGWRLGLDLVRSAAHAKLKIETHDSRRNGGGLIIWADRDLGVGKGTVHPVRHVSEWRAILAGLAERLPSYQIVVFRGSEHSPQQTVELFSRAVAVVGPSGSALHNILFCKPHTLVVEVLPEDLSYANIWQDSSLLGCVSPCASPLLPDATALPPALPWGDGAGSRIAPFKCRASAARRTRRSRQETGSDWCRP